MLKPHQRRIFSRYRGKSNAFMLCVIILIAVNFVAFIQIDRHIRPIIRDLAVARIRSIGTKAINDAVTYELETKKGQYDGIVVFSRNKDGEVTALSTDMMKINLLKSEITNIVVASISAIDTSQINIPLGNILGGGILSGRGPRIPIKIVPLGTANAQFISMFSSAGINQTLHRIIMEPTVTIGILLPGFSTTSEITAQITIAENVIVGSVPDNYTYIDDTETSLLGKINDYSRQGSS